MASKTTSLDPYIQTATEIWNSRYRYHQVKFGLKSIKFVGDFIICDAVLGFNIYKSMAHILDGEFTVGRQSTSWEDPMEFVYGLLECFEESYHMLFEAK